MYADPKAVRLGFITGVLLTHKTQSFERVLFRATRGNMFLKQSPIEGKLEDPGTGSPPRRRCTSSSSPANAPGPRF